MLSDPQSITISDRNSGSAISLPAISRTANQSTYRSDDGSVELLVSQTEGKRNRRSFRVNLSDITPDPFIPANNVKTSASFYVVWDTPVAGYTTDNMVNLMAGVIGQLTTGTNAVAKDVLGGQT
jgi:hypothetical protein